MFRGFLGSFLDNMIRPNKSNIETLLDSKDCSIEQLMNDNDILTECKWGNQKLLNYLDREKVSQLLDYIIRMPPESSTHDRGHKYPFIASEIFNCELVKVNDLFFTSQVQGQEQQKDQDSLQNSDRKEEDKEQNNSSSEEDNALNQEEDSEHQQKVNQERQIEQHKTEENKEEEEDDFERCNEEDNVLIEIENSDQEHFSFGIKDNDNDKENQKQVNSNHRHNRYEQTDEVDTNDIEINTEEILNNEEEQLNQQDKIIPPESVQIIEHYQDQQKDLQKSQEESEEALIELIEDNSQEQQPVKIVVNENNNEEQQILFKGDSQTNQINVIEEITAEFQEQNQDNEQYQGVVPSIVINQSNNNNEDQLIQQELPNNQDSDNQEEEKIRQQIIHDIKQEIDLEQQENQVQEKEDEREQQFQALLDNQDDQNQQQMSSLLQYQLNDEISTAPTDTQKVNQNRYELFEKLISFLDTEEELNPVLCGYFCKLFQVLTGNKTKEVYTYIYNHPGALDLFINHIYNKSVSEVLIRLLNVSDNVFEEGNGEGVDSIRQSFVYKIVQRLDPKFTQEDHLNASSVLQELVDFKQIYAELTSQRCCQLYKQYIDCDQQFDNSEIESSKVNVLQLLSTIITKYNANENYQKRINITSFQEGVEDLMEDEDVLEFQDSQCSEILVLVKRVITENLTKILQEEDQSSLRLDQQAAYGNCRKPFGVLRTRAVEFLSQAFQIFGKEVHQIVFETKLYNSLLNFFQLYPFHNILHQKVCDIFLTTIDKNMDDINKILEETNLIKMILEIDKEGLMFKFEGSERQTSMGYNIFIRKLANKIVDIQNGKSSNRDEVNNILESIPEWREYCDGNLTRINDVENKPLLVDPRKKVDKSGDDDIEYFFKIKAFSQNNVKTSDDNKENNENEKNEDDNDEEEMDFEKSQNNVQYENQKLSENETFENIMNSKDNDDDDKGQDNNNDNQNEQNNENDQYLSNGHQRYKDKIFFDADEDEEEQQQSEPLSLEDLQPQPKQIETQPEYDSNNFWKCPTNDYQLDELLKDYQ